MLFNSVEYFFFLAIVVPLHFALPPRYRWGLLLFASYFFYASWNARYLALILVSTGVDYVAARAMSARAQRAARRPFLVASIITNLGLLFVFKYWNFFAESTSALSHALGGSWNATVLDVALPVGISFYTFQTLSYTIDVYRGLVTPERHLGRFALYVSFFPQLVAGPIERAKNLIPQISRPRAFDWDRASRGLQLVLWGLFKKVVVADRLSLYVDTVYGNVGAHTATSYLIATYAFAFQIYCDFSGYSDIAIGSARILGFDLMKNFARPYFATSIQDFWRRWHISLSTWLRDYLYVPLGGNRKGVHRTYVNLAITMLLGGLWHGASWTFVIWGALHGGGLALTRMLGGRMSRVPAWSVLPASLRFGAQAFVTFHFVCLSWVFFRAESVSDGFRILGAFTGTWGAPFVDAPTMLRGAIGVAVVLVVHTLQARVVSVRSAIATRPLVFRWACWYALVFSIVLLGVGAGRQFIYFQF